MFSLTVFITGQRSLSFSFSVPFSFSITFSVPFPFSFSFLFPLPLPLCVPLLVTLTVGVGLTLEVHPSLVVEAYPFSVASGRSHDGAAHLSEPQGGAVEHGVLGVVLEAVVDDEAEVCFKGIKGEVAVGFKKVPHSLEVHGSVDVVQVIWNLERRRWRLDWSATWT